MVYTTVFLTTGVFLAAGHLLSWNIDFGDGKVQTLWRVCTLAVLVGVVLLAISFGMLESRVVKDSWIYQLSASVFVAVGTLTYMLSRLILLYLVVYSFHSLPAGVYDNIDWLNYIPCFR